MKKIAVIILVILSSCTPQVPDEPVHVTWNGMFEDEVQLFGTFAIDATFDGQNMGYPGGNGTISGTITITGPGGVPVLSSGISGSWENDMEGGYDEFNYAVLSDDSRLILSDAIAYDKVIDMDNYTYSIGAIELDGIPGSFHLIPSDITDAIPDVISAVTVDSTGSFHDLTWIGSLLYGTVTDGNTYSLVSINPADGTVSAQASTCSEPYAVCYDGTYSWVIDYYDQALPTPPDCSLYKYSGTGFGTDEGGYPVENSELNAIDSIDFYGSSIYYHRGFFNSSIGTVASDTGNLTELLAGSMGSGPAGMYRSDRIEVISNGYYNVYFAAGGEWCRIQRLNSSGDLVDYDFCPVNDAGPITINGDNLYIILPNPNRLYVIEIS